MAKSAKKTTESKDTESTPKEPPKTTPKETTKTTAKATPKATAKKADEKIEKDETKTAVKASPKKDEEIAKSKSSAKEKKTKKELKEAITESKAETKESYPWIAESLQALAVPVSTLSPDPENARFHPDENVRAIKESLRRFGQDQPLVVQKSTGIVRKGNGRLQAAKELGWSHIAVVYIEEDNVEATARAVADNRTAELAKWDQRVLSQVMRQIQEEKPDIHPQTLGFTQDQVERLHSKFQQMQEEGATAILDPDEKRLRDEEENSDQVRHVRMVQLFLNTQSHPIFNEMAAKLAEHYNAQSLTDTVMECLRREYERALSDVPADVDCHHPEESPE